MSRILFGLIVVFVLANVAFGQQCNSGVNATQVQANLTANQSLALQQAAIARAAAAPQQQVVVPQRTVFTQPLSVSQLAAAPICTTCTNQVAQAPLQRPASQQPQLVLTMPGSNTPVKPGRYVMAPTSQPAAMRLARN